MCYHYGLAKDKQALEKRFKAKAKSQLPLPFFHVSAFEEKARQLPVITNEAPESIQLFSWGLIPSWSATKKVAFQTQNAVSEEIEAKPTYRALFQNRHCLIPSDGFYEWQHNGNLRTPYFVALREQSIFSFAGLWDCWEDPLNGALLHSFTILTTKANSEMARIHNTKKRMPIILAIQDEEKWLAPPISKVAHSKIFKGVPSSALAIQPANTQLLKIIDGPEKRIPFGHQGSLF